MYYNYIIIIICVCVSVILICFYVGMCVWKRWTLDREGNFWKCLMNIFLSNYLIDYTEEICLLPAESRAEVEHLNINIYGVITSFDLWLTGSIYWYHSQPSIYLFLQLSLHCVLASWGATRHCTERGTQSSKSANHPENMHLRAGRWEVINSSVCSVNYLRIWFFTTHQHS